jgi:succinate-semialdehyde dehydrogenase/glutarate-semialdehyde dehydrogenase
MTAQASVPYRSFNPNDGELLKEFDLITDAELEDKLATASAAFRTWRTVPFAERAAMMSRAAAILRSQEDRFASLVTREMGKLLVESRGEVQLSADILDYYATNAERLMAPEPIETRRARPSSKATPSASCSAWSRGTSPTTSSPALPRRTSWPAMWSW